MGEEMQRGQFTFYRSYFEAIETLPPEDQLQIYRAVAMYGLNGTQEDLNGIAKTVFLLIKPTLDTGRRKAAAGQIGGKNPKQSESKTEATSKQRESKEKAKRKQSESNEQATRKQDESKTKATSKQTASEKEKEGEKEREGEIEIEKENDSYILRGAEPAPAPAESPVITIPLVDGSEYPILQKQVTEWQALYPAVDVMQSLRNMRGWCIGNPKKKKTKNGILRFVTSWLGREQDKGGNWNGQSITPASGHPGTGGPAQWAELGGVTQL